VSPATKARVLEAANEYGYIAHPAMQELLSGQTSLVGGIVPAVNSPFFMDLMQAAAIHCADAGLRLLITPVKSESDFRGALKEFAARRFRGALVVPPRDNIALPEVGSVRVASFIAPSEGVNVRSFLPDEVDIGAKATQYLVEHGHRRIAHLTYARKSLPIIDRATGYRNTMRVQGLHERVIVDDGGKELADVVTSVKPTAILCHNDWLALDVIRRLGTLGYRVPDDISVMGVDDSPTFKALYPGITTMRYPMDEVASDAVQWIITGSQATSSYRSDVVEGGTVCSPTP
jgi:LacI family transcriptional regulator